MPFFKKYMQSKKIPGIVIILAHIISWIGVLTLLNFFSTPFPKRNQNDVYTQILIILTIISFFYLNYFFLIPQFLAKRKFILYIIIILFSITLFTYTGEFILFLNRTNNTEQNAEQRVSEFKKFNEERGQHPHPPRKSSASRGFSIFLITFLISTGIKMTHEWFKYDKQKREVENDKLKAELSMLKAQINPHFFFNVLNNICSLARSKSDKTETAIIKLSQLMRYNIYDQKEDKVNLKNEVQFIEDYIDIQKMRIAGSVKISFTKSGNLDLFSIEPMLLFPFVENAFKHGISYEEESKITIDLNIKENQLFFYVYNTVNEANKNEAGKFKGIGLQNVLKRLDLLYADRYSINIKEENKSYEVHLNVKL